MSWIVLPHASMCIASDRLVLLDTRQNRYFMVPPARTGAVLAWLTAPSSTPPPSMFLTLLRTAGVHVQGDPDPVQAQAVVRPIPMALSDGASSGAASLKTIAAVSRIVLATAFALKRRPFQAILEDQSTERRSSSGAYETQAALAQRFHAARRFVPVERCCLVDSLSLKRWLRQHEQDVPLVFGVSSLPFAAHCWLQNEVALLNDSYDRVSRFTPICVL